MKTLFSVLYNEDELFLNALVRNFVMFTGNNEFLIINVGVNAPVNVAYVQEKHSRVKIWKADRARSVLGSGLLLGHIDNYSKGSQLFGDIDYFCTIASNSLFVQDFDVQRAISTLSPVNPLRISKFDEAIHDPWFFLPRILASKHLISTLRRNNIEFIVNHQIEGFFASKSNWDLIARVTAELPDIGAHNNDPDDTLFPYEEVIPATITHALGDGYIGLICKVFWGKQGTDAQYVSAKDLLYANNPSEILFKWFRRDPANLETYLVSTALGRAFLAIARRADKSDASDIMVRAMNEFSRLITASLYDRAPRLITCEHFLPYFSFQSHMTFKIGDSVRIIDSKTSDYLVCHEDNAYVISADIMQSIVFDLAVLPSGDDYAVSINSKGDMVPCTIGHCGFIYIRLAYSEDQTVEGSLSLSCCDSSIFELARELAIRSGDTYITKPFDIIDGNEGIFAIGSAPDDIRKSSRERPTYIGLPLISGYSYSIKPIFKQKVKMPHECSSLQKNSN